MEAKEDIDMSAKPDSRTVEKRDGSKQPFDKQKILNRLSVHAEGLDNKYVTLDEVVEKVTSGLYEGKHIPHLYRHNYTFYRR